jgi:hypothetical protein
VVINKKLSTDVIHRVCATPNSTLNLASYLTRSVRSILAGEPLRRIARRRSLVLLGALCIVGTTPAEAMTETDHYKLYLHTKIIDFKRFNCAIEIAHRESRWNYKAQNHSHYGLFQMRNKKVQYMNPYTQIDWWHRYLMTRYKGDACLALAHLKAKGWQ